MGVYRALINTLSAHMIHINLTPSICNSAQPAPSHMIHINLTDPLSL